MARCLTAHDDEAFTYVETHKTIQMTVRILAMIVRALERGVSEEKLASALNVNIHQIKRWQCAVRRRLPGSRRSAQGQGHKPGNVRGASENEADATD